MPSEKRKGLLDKAAREYAESVSLVRPYLKERGLTDDVIERWQLGCVLDPLPGHEKYRRWLSIPYITRAGVLEMKFRCVEDHDCEENGHKKYLCETGSKTFLFGAMSFWVDSPFICVTEGELDAVACDVAGLPAIGVSGTAKWQKHWQYCFEGYEEVIVLADGDKAGEKLASNVSNHVHTARVLTFPAGGDVNAYLVEHGADALRRKVLGDG